MNNTAKSSSKFNWQDPFLIEAQLTAEERMIRDAAQAYCQDKLMPRVLEQFRNEQTDPRIFREMGELGLLGPTIGEQYGGSGLNYVSYGLIAREIEGTVYDQNNQEFTQQLREHWRHQAIDYRPGQAAAEA